MFHNLFSPIIIIMLILLFTIIIIFIRSYIECKTYKIDKISIKNSKNDKRIRLIFITDFHNKSFDDNYEKIISDIKNLNPDYIILGGDFIDYSAFNSTFGNVRYKNTIKLIEKLSRSFDYNIKNTNYNLKQILFSYGNHELRFIDKCKNNDDKAILHELFDTLKKANITILDNSSYELSNCAYIYGLSLYDGYYHNIFSKNKNIDKISNDLIDDKLGGIDQRKFNIVLFHKPDYVEDLINYGFDLVLSGHNHGGLIKLTNSKSLISPDFKLFPKYSAGLYKVGSGHAIVSCGLGEHFIKIRVNNKPTLYVIDIL